MDGETYSPHHARHYTAYGDGSDRPATRRRVLQAGAAAAALGLAGCASLRNRPTDDTIPLDDEHDSEDHGGGTPRAVQAGSGAVHVVGSAPTDHDTIQAAFDAAAPGDLVNVTQSYDPSGETWPVVSKKVLTVEADGQLPGSDGIVFDTDNRRPPGPVLRDVPITGGARGIVFRIRISRIRTAVSSGVVRASPVRSRTPSRPTVGPIGVRRTPSNCTAVRRFGRARPD